MQKNSRTYRISPREMVIFAMLGTLMFASKIIMEALPNIHLLGMLTMVYTLVFRSKALLPIYVFVTLTGLYAGFSVWWVPYLYIWTVLWCITMLLPKKMPKAVAIIVYPIVCGLHGLAFGTLYAPTQALFFGFSFEQTLTWIAMGFWFDVTHCIGNVVAGIFIVPFSALLKRLALKPQSSR